MKPNCPLSLVLGTARAGAAGRAFTLIELLVVISIIGVLAGLVVGVAPAASKRMREARVKSELAALTAAIEAYKSKYGVYPPDNYDPERRITNPVLNSLFYELTGVLVDNDPRKPLLITADENQAINPDVFRKFFGREGVLNSVPRIETTPGPAQHKLDVEQKKNLMRREFKPGQHAEIFRSKGDGGYEDLEVLAVGFSMDASGKRGGGFVWPPRIPKEQHPVPTNPGLNPWRYVSTNPTNNPGRFDLWAEVVEGNRTNIFGNW